MDPLNIDKLDNAQFTSKLPSDSPPSTHQPNSVIGGTTLSKYHSETLPCMHSITSEELTAYEDNPPKLVGKKFIPLNGEDLWEVLEVTFNQKGWSAVMQFEGSDRHHRMILDDFLLMLKTGELNVVELE